MNAMLKLMTLVVFSAAATAGALTLDSASLPVGWQVNDLSQEFGIKAQKPGARLSLTFGKDANDPEATVFAFVSKPLARPLGTDLAAWTKLLIGENRRTKAKVTLVNGVPHYRAYAISTSSGGVEMHALVLAVEMENRIVMFSSEETVETYQTAHRRAGALFDVVRVQSVKTPRRR